MYFYLLKYHYNSEMYVSYILGGARLSYSCIAFANNSTILATHSGIPDFQLTIW